MGAGSHQNATGQQTDPRDRVSAPNLDVDSRVMKLISTCEFTWTHTHVCGVRIVIKLFHVSVKATLPSHRLVGAVAMVSAPPRAQMEARLWDSPTVQVRARWEKQNQSCDLLAHLFLIQSNIPILLSINLQSKVLSSNSENKIHSKKDDRAHC